jgi:hypothetical protein
MSIVNRPKLWVTNSTAAFATFMCGVLMYAQQPPPALTANVSVALSRLQSEDLREREAAFHELMAGLASGSGARASSHTAEVLTGFFKTNPQQSEPLKIGLIRLLAKENSTFIGEKVPPGTYSEEDTEYYANLIDAVSSLSDERAIPALVGAMTTGRMASRGLLKYGDKALPLLLDQLKSSDPLMRSAALGNAISILRPMKDPASRARSKDLLRSSLSDPDSAVRTQAVMLVACSDEREDFLAALQQIAANDPDRFPGRADDGIDGNWYYTVRVQARRVLRDIQDKKSCQP